MLNCFKCKHSGLRYSKSQQQHQKDNKHERNAFKTKLSIVSDNIVAIAERSHIVKVILHVK